jgi:hypothetical protein
MERVSDALDPLAQYKISGIASPEASAIAEQKRLIKDRTDPVDLA